QVKRVAAGRSNGATGRFEAPVGQGDNRRVAAGVATWVADLGRGAGRSRGQAQGIDRPGVVPHEQGLAAGAGNVDFTGSLSEGAKRHLRPGGIEPGNGDRIGRRQSACAVVYSARYDIAAVRQGGDLRLVVIDVAGSTGI